MSYLTSLPAESTLLEVFRAYPDTARPLLEFHEQVMRHASPFSVAERELIAAYVSGLNACDYCHGVHTATAEAFGVPAGVLAASLADLDAAPIDERMKPVLRYVGTLTRTPSRVTAADTAAVYAAGWDERALHDAALVCALFNFMNRLVDGLGVRADPGYFEISARRLHDRGYAALAELLDVGTDG
ncbi:peroxidase-related enzyme [Actinomycetes bacterium KLBMP 9797]